MASFFKEAQLKLRRKETRVGLVGADGVNIQDARERAAKTPKEKGREVQRRMAEYKSGIVKKDKVIDKVKRYKNPGNR